MKPADAARVHAERNHTGHNHAERYCRQTGLALWGGDGQTRLAQARILMVGAGGLGHAVLPWLAGAGIGRITVMDGDRIEQSNLHRQILFEDAECGASKAEVMTRALRKRNPEITVVSRPEALTAENAGDAMRGQTLVIDGTDDPLAKRLMSDEAMALGLTLIHGAVSGFEARVAVFTPGTCCWRCLYPDTEPERMTADCQTHGVFGPAVALTGAVQASEAVKFLLGAPKDQTLQGRLWASDALNMTSRSLRIPARCPRCTGGKTSRPAGEPCQSPPSLEISLTDARAAYRAQKMGFIDVREQEERRVGQIAPSIHLPLSRLSGGDSESIKEQGVDPARPWVVYCQRGRRSRKAVLALRAWGCRQVWSLAGGYKAWCDASPGGGVSDTENAS